ncbi:winged helix-turn-helix domain-containing protein, partial [Salmonella sp. SAL04165]|uniref:winged helix-turn-helix domain-containing protein n=1 Tax=unclassified Salmonella TaxID=2614656 RepID=UPI003978582B|nr:hypothetical protein [Salmonella enterica]MCQ7352569.1 hypothetical protein [Salmonella enterica]MCQ7420380.1 hypothetical protein [Salmonella enterica]MCQ7424774.1 hypothetical protein [Salmonella enterica]MCQ7429150.1 hypothetical protein [Salmonella enterica]
MKTYIINSNCIYNEGKYELRTVSNSQVIKMTAMRAKCLSFIIENAHLEIIERQKITTALWGSRSHYVNDANLTQILYLIRRDLKALGGFAPIFPDTCYHLTHYWPAAADIPV